MKPLCTLYFNKILLGAIFTGQLGAVKANFPNQHYKGKILFMALANRMERGMDTLKVQKDTTEGTELIRSNLTFIKD